MGTEQAKRERSEANSAYLKMRSEYRARLADMEIGIDAAAFVNLTTGLLNGPKLKDGLKITIPAWDNLPPPGRPETIQLFMDRGDGQLDPLGPPVEFIIPPGGTAFPEPFPHEITIDVNELPDSATCRLQYVHRSFQGIETPSQIRTVICDRLPPYGHAPPSAPAFTGDFLDETTLPPGGKLTVTILGYDDWQDTDKVYFYLVGSNSIPDDPSLLTPIFSGPAPSPGIGDSTIQIDGDLIRAMGDAEAVLIYVLRDEALNPSALSNPKKVSLTFGLLPTNLQKPRVPQATPGPLTMAHIQAGVSAWIKYDNPKGGDALRLLWGGQPLADFEIGANPPAEFEVPVLPASLMLEDYGRTTTGNKATAVSYQVIRKGRPFGPEFETFNVNFATALPWPDPWPPVDWPDPVHPDLPAGTVKNFDDSRTNQLTRADKDKDANFDFTWYNAAVNGHIIDFFWNGTKVDEAHIVFDDKEAGHVPGDAFRVEIPWQYIKDAGNGDPVPVHYTVSGPGLVNDLLSSTTDVSVNAIAVELPAGKFPTFASQPVPDYPGCGALELDGALKVEIPDLTGRLKAGDKINVVFTPMKTDDLNAPEDPITNAIFEEEFTLGEPASPLTGFVFLVQPYADHILPIYSESPNKRGRVKLEYVFNDGTEEITSVSVVSLCAFHTLNGSCPIP